MNFFKTIFLLAIGLAFFQNSVSSQVTFDGNGQGITSANPAATSVTISNFTVPSGADRVLVVFITTDKDPISVSYNGVIGTLIESVSDGRSTSSAYVLSLGTGASSITSDIVATIGGNGRFALLSGGSFHGVDQTNPTGSSASAFRSSGTTSFTLATSANNMGVMYCWESDSFTPTRGSGQSFLAGNQPGQVPAGDESSYKLATGNSITLSYDVNQIQNTSIAFDLVSGCDDPDGDGICSDVDNCPTVANADQTDTDGDGDGDACDEDDDNDGCLDADDANPLVASNDSDCDGVADDCDVCDGGDDSVDNNNDGIPDCSQLLLYEDYSDDWKCKNNKIEVCHFANNQTLCISKNALPAHFLHGDYVGPCTSCGGSNLVANPNSGENYMEASEDIEEVEIFPNPASNVLNLHAHLEADEAIITVYDAMGRLAWQQKIQDHHINVQIDLTKAEFHAGVYTIQVIAGDFRTVKRVVVSK